MWYPYPHPYPHPHTGIFTCAYGHMIRTYAYPGYCATGVQNITYRTFRYGYEFLRELAELLGTSNTPGMVRFVP